MPHPRPRSLPRGAARHGPAPLEPDLYQKLREDIRLRGIQIPILVDSAPGEVIDGRLRKQVAAELKIKAIPTIHVGRLSEREKADLRLAVNLYRRHLSRAQMRDLLSWSLKQAPGESDRSVARKTGTSHPTVARVRREMESGGTIYHLTTRGGSDGKKYPAAKPTVYSTSTVEGRRATSLLNRLGDDAPPGPASLHVLHKRLALKERETLGSGPEASLPARIRIERCDFRELPVPDGSVDLIFTDPIWGEPGRALMPEFATWAARKLKPDGGLLLLYTGHAGLLEVGGEIAKSLNYLWTISCVNGPDNGRSTRHALMIRVCWRPVLMFCRGKYRPDRVGRVFDDVVISESSRSPPPIPAAVARGPVLRQVAERPEGCRVRPVPGLGDDGLCRGTAGPGAAILGLGGRCRNLLDRPSPGGRGGGVSRQEGCPGECGHCSVKAIRAESFSS